MLQRVLDFSPALLGEPAASIKSKNVLLSWAKSAILAHWASKVLESRRLKFAEALRIGGDLLQCLLFQKASRNKVPANLNSTWTVIKGKLKLEIG